MFREPPAEVFMPPNMLKAKVGGTVAGLEVHHDSREMHLREQGDGQRETAGQTTDGQGGHQEQDGPVMVMDPVREGHGLCSVSTSTAIPSSSS